MGRMIEAYATASDFRNHVAQITNCVAYRQDRCVITRHGREVAALVSWEDLEFLRKHKPRKLGPPSIDIFSPKAAWRDHFPEDAPADAATEPQPLEDEPEDLIAAYGDPFRMSIDEIVPVHAEISAREGESLGVDWWLARARICLKGAGLYPRGPPKTN